MSSIPPMIMQFNLQLQTEYYLCISFPMELIEGDYYIAFSNCYYHEDSSVAVLSNEHVTPYIAEDAHCRLSRPIDIGLCLLNWTLFPQATTDQLAQSNTSTNAVHRPTLIGPTNERLMLPLDLIVTPQAATQQLPVLNADPTSTWSIDVSSQRPRRMYQTPQPTWDSFTEPSQRGTLIF